MWVTRFAKSHPIFISKSQFLSLADGKSKSITPLRINLNCPLCEQSPGCRALPHDDGHPPDEKA